MAICANGVNGDKSGVNLDRPLYICSKQSEMLTGLQHTHWLLAALVLIVLSVTVFSMIIGGVMKAKFNNFANRITLFTLILSHLQLLVGLILYFLGDKGVKHFNREDVMSNGDVRFYAVEHISVMILAIILITIGRSGLKRKATDAAKFRHGIIYFGIGWVLILSRVPWKELFNLPF